MSISPIPPRWRKPFRGRSAPSGRCWPPRAGSSASARGLSVFRLTAVDGPVTLHITFFNAKYTVDSLREGEEYLFYGTLTGGFYARQMDSPQVFRPEEAGTLLPVYPLTQGLSNKMVSRQVTEASTRWSSSPILWRAAVCRSSTA